MHQPLVHAGLAMCGAWFRNVPMVTGKRRLWYHLARPLAARCERPLTASTRFGARMALLPPDTIQTFIACFGVWEPAISAYISGMLAPGDTVVDVGANVGYVSLLAAHCTGPTGRVHAIEASPSLFAALVANIRQNRLTTIIAHHAAATDQPGEVPIHLHGRVNLGASTILPALAQQRGARWEATVTGLPLPALVPEADLRAARLIKIDVEGAEWQVLRGLAPALPRLSPRAEMLVEVNAQALAAQGADVPALLEMMSRAGFQPWTIPNTYQVDEYLTEPPPAPAPLRDAGFEQADLLFRRD